MGLDRPPVIVGMTITGILYGVAVFASMSRARVLCCISVFVASASAAGLAGDPLAGVAAMAVTLVGILAVSGRRWSNATLAVAYDDRSKRNKHSQVY